MTTRAVRVREQRRQRGSSSATTLSAKKSKNEEKEMDKNNERTRDPQEGRLPVSSFVRVSRVACWCHFALPPLWPETLLRRSTSAGQQRLACCGRRG